MTSCEYEHFQMQFEKLFFLDVNPTGACSKVSF